MMSRAGMEICLFRNIQFAQKLRIISLDIEFDFPQDDTIVEVDVGIVKNHEEIRKKFGLFPIHSRLAAISVEQFNYLEFVCPRSR